jgi:hypothetical protein
MIEQINFIINLIGTGIFLFALIKIYFEENKIKEIESKNYLGLER